MRLLPVGLAQRVRERRLHVLLAYPRALGSTPLLAPGEPRGRLDDLARKCTHDALKRARRVVADRRARRELAHEGPRAAVLALPLRGRLRRHFSFEEFFFKF